MTSQSASLVMRAKNVVRPLLDLVDPGRVVRVKVHNWLSQRAYRGLDVCAPESGNAALKKAVMSGEPFAAGKFGSTESKLYNSWKQAKSGGGEIPEAYRRELFVNSGVFPSDSATLDHFCETYLDSAKLVDHLGIWRRKGEIDLIRDGGLDKACHLFELTGLEPYYFDEPWSQALAGRKVLVISPFAESVQQQFEKRDRIWSRPVLPKFDLRVLKFPHSKAIAANGYASWQEILDDMRSRMDSIDYDIVLTGAGAATLVLAAHARKRGKQGVGLGGALQCLFGIMGRRWENDPFFRAHANESWTRPTGGEVPGNARIVESGAYW